MRAGIADPVDTDMANIILHGQSVIIMTPFARSIALDHQTAVILIIKISESGPQSGHFDLPQDRFLSGQISILVEISRVQREQSYFILVQWR